MKIKKVLQILAYVFLSFIITLIVIVHIVALSQKNSFNSNYELSHLDICPERAIYPRVFNLCSVNMWGRPLASSTTFRFQRFADAVLDKELDFLVLQEVFRHKDIELLETKLACTYPWRIIPKETKFPRVVNWLHSGLVIYSKYPIIYWESEVWDATNWLENYASKGVLRIDVQYGVDTFSIFDLHMIADMKNHKYHDLRDKQLIQLREFISKSPYPKLVIGDFNTKLNVVQELLNEKLRIEKELYRQITINHTRNPYFDKICGGRGKKKTIDFILSCDQVEFNNYKVDEEIFYSDHALITVSITLDIGNKIRGPDE